MENTLGAAGARHKAVNAAYKGYKDGSVEFFGDQIEALTGFRREQFNSKEVLWTDLILEEDRSAARAAFVRALQGDKNYVREYRVRTLDGKTLWLREFSQIVCNERGEVEFIAGHLMDITEEKLTELSRLERERKTGKYLTFSMAGESYAIEILRVREIIGLAPITTIPQAPPYVKGVINLRGQVIPIIDLRSRLGLPPVNNNGRTCMVIVEAQTGNSARTGIVVDSVSEVLNIRGEQVEDAPFFGTAANRDWILGMAKMEESIQILLDLDRIVGNMPAHMTR